MNWMISNTILLQLPRFGPRSGAVNDNRLQWKYRYKLAIKQAERNANQAFNDELFEYTLVQRMTIHFGRRVVKDIVHLV